jgi:feruloyl-CoA synthase
VSRGPVAGRPSVLKMAGMKTEVRAGYNKASMLPPAVVVERRDDGCVMVRSPHPLGEYPRRLTERLQYWAEHAGDRCFLAQRGPDHNWRYLTYSEAFTRVRRISQALLDRGLSADRPVAILSGNDLEHALLSLAAQHVGIICAPVSPAYSLMSTDHARVRHIVSVLSPGLVFAASGKKFAKAIEAAVPEGIEIVVTTDPPPDRNSTPFSDLEVPEATADVDTAFSKIQPESIAKILFTSGSTGLPKGVVTTHKMLCSNQRMMAAVLPFLADEPPVMVDWLPWHHTFGGSHNFGMILQHGGTLYIDDGRPVPGGFEDTVRNLREIAPTVYFNVPKGYEFLIPYLRAEPRLRDRFFSRARFLFYAAAALSVPLWNDLRELAHEADKDEVPLISALGSTETAPAALLATWDAGRPGVIGLPLPGAEVKLVPSGNKLELRTRGPNVMPGYYREPEKTAQAFDEEGFYMMGDAVRFVDPSDPNKGLEFNGRIAEDFKLATGTWVNVGAMRMRMIHGGDPYVRDVVVAGHDRDYLSVLVFPDLDACRKLCPGRPAGSTAGAVLSSDEVRASFQQLLDRLAAEATGSANRIERALLVEEPPSIDASEITDKGSINQRAVLERRFALVEELYETPASARVIVSSRAAKR